MQKQAAMVVKDVLAVVGCVHQGRGTTLLAKHAYKLGKYAVGLQYGVVVSVEQLRSVLCLCLCRYVGQKAGIALYKVLCDYSLLLFRLAS